MFGPLPLTWLRHEHRWLMRRMGHLECLELPFLVLRKRCTHLRLAGFKNVKRFACIVAEQSAPYVDLPHRVL